VAAVADNAWQEPAKKAMEYVRSKAEQRVGCKVEVISGLNLLKELISSEVLGIRLYQSKIYLTGPEDYGCSTEVPPQFSSHICLRCHSTMTDYGRRRMKCPRCGSRKIKEANALSATTI